MTMFAMWVPGSAAVVDLKNPTPTRDVSGQSWTAVVGSRVGGTVIYRCAAGQDVTFHYPIPTPVIVNNNRAKMLRAMVFFNARAGTTFKALTVYDGAATVPCNGPGLNVTGNHPPSPGGLQEFVTSFQFNQRPSVNWGVDLALVFHFSSEQDLTLYGAGVDFDV